MLVALVNGKIGPAWAVGLSVLVLLCLFPAAIVAAQTMMPERFGCLVYFGEDFVAMYAVIGLVIERQGAGIYDPSALSEDGLALLSQLLPSCGPATPAVYLPALLLPVFPLTLLPAMTAYYAWSVLTISAFALGLWRLSRADGVGPSSYWLIAGASMPVISGLGEGQVHGVQFLAIVGFWLALRRQDDRSAGLWLSLQLVKFQFLPLVLLHLLWHRRWRVLKWFALAGLLWLGFSVLLAGGTDGAVAYARIILRVVAPLDSPYSAAGMVNWRGQAVRWVASKDYSMVGAITAVLTLTTVGLVIWSWRRSTVEAARLEPQQFLVLMAATLLVGYDTHAFSLVLLLPPALGVLAELSRASGGIARLWSALLDLGLVVPTLLLVAGFAFGVFPPVGTREALLLGLVALFVAGVFSPRVEHLGRSARPTSAS